ncbi:Pycsar system effector family protein [Rubrobacter aplysinae]|uniref:Pycsar system effector family protein n=1 Tax=Rubrobacter aplysinae TaxID=909625 RepID=UPI00064C3589|nr:Pycsar system effector family protein [Rubrobacter aplysinae]
MSETQITKQEQLEAAERRLDRLFDWVGRSDTKFSIILGVDTGMLGFLATSAPASASVPVISIILAVVSVLLLVASLIFIYRGTYPRTRGPGASLIYFGSIAGEELANFRQRFRGCDADDHLDDVLEQVHRNSEILDSKFKELQRAYRCLLAAILPWASALYLFGVFPPPV